MNSVSQPARRAKHEGERRQVCFAAFYEFMTAYKMFLQDRKGVLPLWI